MRWAWTVGLAVASIAAAAAPAGAQTAGAQTAAIKGPYTLFISPCGEPFRAQGGKPYPVLAWFERTDANHDHAIDRAEFRADAKGFFAVLDADHNGTISGLEVSRYEHEIAPEILSGVRLSVLGRPRVILAQYDPNYSDIPTVSGDATRLNGDQPPPVDPASTEGAAMFNLLAEPEPVASSDGNFDGRITAAEFQAAADRRFKRLDRNGDGKLVLSELPQTVQQRVAAQARARR